MHSSAGADIPPTSYGHVPVIPPRIGPSPPRPDDRLIQRFRESPSSNVSDAVGRLYTMDSGVKALYEPIRRTVGVALTVKAYPGDNLAVHGALAMVQAGDVLVVDWQGYREGCGSGAFSLMVPIKRGLTGVIIDGGWRDVDELQALDFPVFGRSEVAFSPAKREPGELNVPVCCGGVIVEAGDIVVADAEGVCVVPRRHAEDVAQALSPATGGDGRMPPPPAVLESDAEERGRQYELVFRERGGLRGPEPGAA